MTGQEPSKSSGWPRAVSDSTGGQYRCIRCGNGLWAQWMSGSQFTCRSCGAVTDKSDARWEGIAPHAREGLTLVRDFRDRSEEEAKAQARQTSDELARAGWIASGEGEWIRRSLLTGGSYLRVTYHPDLETARRLAVEEAAALAEQAAAIAALGRPWVVCESCGAGIECEPFDTGYTCAVCGKSVEYFWCPECRNLQPTDPSTLASYARYHACRNEPCKKTFRLDVWRSTAMPATTRASLYAQNYGRTQESIARPDARQVIGVVLSSSGFIGIGEHVGCVLVCDDDRVTVMADVDDEMQVVAAVPYAEISTFQFDGPGTVKTEHGGGWMGGGFGVKGAMKGAITAGVLNALTTWTETSVQTSVHLASGMHDLVLFTNTATPETLRRSFSPVFARIQALRSASMPNAASPAVPATPLEARLAALRQLGELRDAGVLTDEEFAAEKARILTS